ncbi:cAMP-responsive element modulator-like isoform X2 [Lampris incognitus]|uniref:cAMP-responsive element modulator-like isoform X2 n=1 Tax=Lampris incognitus TaxID=2546036 RepID=UPI0024B4823B|nr:cAMP-responsive element modulator-like isoform X2 [Lampris incognitus]
MAVTGDETESAATGDVSAYQLRNPSSCLPQDVVMAGVHGPQQPTEDASRRRELRLMKNREAAKACRQRKREYMNYLETRISILEKENMTLKAKMQYQNVHSI